MPTPISDALTAGVAVTVFAVMLRLGLGISLAELRQTWRPPGPLLRGLAVVLVGVPLLALGVARLLALPRAAEIGLLLMAISPSVPVALRRALEAGGRHGFAPGLQIAAALTAVVSLPLSIALLDRYYDGHAELWPWDVARQVFVAQLLPLALGMALHHRHPERAARLAARLGPLTAALMLLTLALVAAEVGPLILTAGWRMAAAVALLTVAALASGHLLAGGESTRRTAVAIAGAARNPGLALLVAAQNGAGAPVYAAILAYLFVSFAVITPYALWRRRFSPPP
jgi:BASS family bile acid:Na+ symporter